MVSNALVVVWGVGMIVGVGDVGGVAGRVVEGTPVAAPGIKFAPTVGVVDPPHAFRTMASPTASTADLRPGGSKGASGLVAAPAQPLGESASPESAA
jgi:hypothetical protein